MTGRAGLPEALALSREQVSRKLIKTENLGKEEVTGDKT